MKVRKLHDRHWRRCGTLERRSRHPNVGAECERWLEVNCTLGLRSERLKKGLSAGGQLLVLKVCSDLRAKSGFFPLKSTPVGLIKGFDLLLGDLADLRSHCGVAQSRHGDAPVRGLASQEALVDQRLDPLAF